MDRKPVGVIEAKKEDLGQNITTAEVQTGDYAAAKLKWVQNTGKPLSFLYEATGVLTRFTDQRDPKPRSREVFSFHRPKTLRKNADQPLNPNQIAWLELIRDRVLTSFLLERDDLDFAPFDARGGLGKMHQLFGDPMDPSSANSTGSWWRESRTGTFVVHETACHAQQIPLSDTDASQTPLWYSRGPQMHHKPTGSSLKMPCNRAIVLHEHQK